MLKYAPPEVRARFMREFTKEILIQTSKNFPKTQLREVRSWEKQLQKIDEILKEEGVQAIECPSPDRYLIVKKNSKLKVLNMMLEEDEIEQIIHFFFRKSGKTPSPAFSISLTQVSISGLLSPRIGSRFIIKKKFG